MFKPGISILTHLNKKLTAKNLHAWMLLPVAPNACKQLMYTKHIKAHFWMYFSEHPGAKYWKLRLALFESEAGQPILCGSITATTNKAFWKSQGMKYIFILYLFVYWLVKNTSIILQLKPLTVEVI